MIKIGDKILVLKNFTGINGISYYEGNILTIEEIDLKNPKFIRFKNATSFQNFESYKRDGIFELIKEESNTQDKIQTLFENFKDFLQEKNKRYGDSVINPVKVFSKVEPTNKACIRLDEKLQRIINSEELRKNDVCDTFGYLALLMIDKGWLTFGEMLD